MHSKNTTITQRAKTWLSSSLFNRDRAGEYFEYLVEGLDPLWSFTDCKAQILDVINETADTKTWVMKPTSRWNGFVAGQHIHITMSVNGVNHTRTFTISSSPYQWQQDQTITITVKKVPDGRITGWMHEHLDKGAVITLSRAQGDFVLNDSIDAPVGYIAAGSGITPVMSQLRTLTANNMPVPASLLYFSNTRQDFIFGSQIQAMSQTNGRFTSHLIASYDDSESSHKLPQSPICAEHIAALLSDKPKEIYICGPHRFREIAKELLAEAGFDLNATHEEAFGLPPVKRVEGEPVTITFGKSALETTSNAPGTLLEMAEGAGLSPTAGCRMGICHTCKCKKNSGQVRNIITGELSSTGQEDIQICISTPISNVEVEL
ncbi:iron-sulfur cluster-binding domain-containing protein [Ketobacter sp. MCCC 1A13808]|uniref:flavin reductase family protein n=1 Tax=Ketobacter sp. MCCC 1A13808 TaxID=2602738 RepID=UPI000F16A3A3|nr:iron-sulfur cluster-binding domain-containing protein [Ketobacter sp. MCCC 1A13808]MVF14161.1 iron-sulfur cluster-binding domain-containing protein [Ketobacter sp. MCCC 1A13808]RLP54070.1 MAG: iron-sulfur cluster-binding domain-containing protein [Ketobacter sp.]